MSRTRLFALLIAAVTAAAPLSPAVAADKRPAEKPWVAGIAMSLPSTPRDGAGYWCSTGLPGVKDGRSFLLTARHCVGKIGQDVHTGWDGGKRQKLGKVAGISRVLDVAAIEVTGAVDAAYWRGTKKQDINQIASLRVGSRGCQHGVRSGTVCNLIVRSIERNNAGQPTRVLAQATSGTAALPGDSGGIVVDSGGRPVGIISSTSADRTWLSYTPALTALAAWELNRTDPIDLRRQAPPPVEHDPHGGITACINAQR